MLSEIEKFIFDFKQYDKENILVKTFTEGYCYWFSFILKTRFPKGDIYYNTMNHFVFKYQNRLFDITGDCTDKWNDRYLYSWNEYQIIEPLGTQRIIRDCINKNN